MVGGHGTAGSFGPLLEQMGAQGAATVAIAAATFGLVMGSVIGGPIARYLIDKDNLFCFECVQEPVHKTPVVGKEAYAVDKEYFLFGIGQLLVAMGIGSWITGLITSFGVTFPSYIGAMLAAAVIRNLSDLTGRYEVFSKEIDVMGSVSLSIFLSMALMGLKLWQLSELALPLVVMLLAQTAMMALFARFVIFNLMGRDYEAAVITAAGCGFGMGATPNAMANMQAICDRYHFDLDLNQKVYEMSVSQKQTLEIVKVLYRGANILILDEPTAGQDYRHYTEIMEFLKHLNETLGITIIMITHDMHLMLEYTDRAIVIADGELIADDKPARVLTDEAVADRAYLKKTSLYDLAVRCGIEDASGFAERFIYYERQVRADGGQNSDVQ